MTALAPIALLLADAGWDHMDGGWWVVMVIGMVLFWALAIGLVVWLARGGIAAFTQAKREPSARQLLDRRLAEGSIDVEEYEQRRAALGRDEP